MKERQQPRPRATSASPFRCERWSTLRLAAVRGDQSRPALVGEQRIPPFEQYAGAIPKARQIHDVDEQPRPPGEPAGQMSAGEHTHRLEPADRREIALIPVSKRLAAFTPNRVEDVPRRRPPALHRRRRDTRY